MILNKGVIGRVTLYIERHYHVVSFYAPTICYPFIEPFGKFGRGKTQTVPIDFNITQKAKSCK